VGRLWGRKVSIHVTRLISPTPVTPDAVTVAMILIGIAAAGSLFVAGVVGALGAVILVQLYLVVDCVDGELARWRAKTSPRGAYLDRVGHYLVEAALFAVYGFHIEQSWASGWVTLSLVTAVLVLITKAETDLVLAVGGMSGDSAPQDQLEPRVSVLRLARRVLHPLRIHRITGAAEATLLMLAASIAHSLGFDDAYHLSIVVFFAVALLLTVGHLAAIATSGRLKPSGT
jgi:phosphatidylglycerophosphate synthase